MVRHQKQSKEDLVVALVKTRRMTSLVDRELAIASGDIKRETVNWIPMWVDWGHTVRSDCATANAIRAITDHGELLWYVRNDTKKHGYHSSHDDPFDAIEEATEAWAKRKLVKQSWWDVMALSKDLLHGREAFDVTLKDAEASALCTLGIRWFLARMRISRKTQISGRTAALLMKIEPQLGFVIYEAALRHGIPIGVGREEMPVGNSSVPSS